MAAKPGRPACNPAPSKGGRPSLRPTAEQRHHVELAVSIGLSIDMISAAMEIPRRSLYRHFAKQIACGRAKRLLANALRLDAMAEAGNVSAARYLHTLMLDHGPASAAAHDQWGDFDEDDILAQNPDFGGLPASAPGAHANGQTQIREEH